MNASAGGYRIIENARLDARNSFGVAARAPMLVEVTRAEALPDLFAHAMPRGAKPLILGGGSNILFAADPEGIVLALATQSIRPIGDTGEDTLVRAEAGAVWHDFVLWTLGHGLSGLENLALIPGTVGAAPIQNIGAYGVEVRERIHAVETFDRRSGAFTRLAPDACAFAYRDSVFKQEPDRFVVTAVEFRLARAFTPRLHYAGLKEELAAMGITDAPRASQVAEAVMRIRRRKLPDPAVLGNAGSFFKNPIVPAATARTLSLDHPDLPTYPSGDPTTSKLSAAWLIDRSGWKGRREGDAGIAPSHALVLVNHGTATGAQLLEVAHRVAADVEARFGIALQPEPRIVGARW